MNALNKNIKKLRSLKGLSQADFAGLFNLSRANIGSYEEGRAQPKMEVVVKMAAYFELSLDDFVNKELSVNDLSKFGELKENDLKMSHAPTEGMVSVSFIKQSAFNKFISIGRSKDHIQLPSDHNATLAVQIEEHALEGTNGLGRGDVGLFSKVATSAIEHGFIHALLIGKKVVIGVCFIERDRIHVKEVEHSANIFSGELSEVRKSWKLSGAIRRNTTNFEYQLLHDRVSELERMIETLMTTSKR